ncbi:MAG: hypothetical protein K2F82_02115 [Muribaculaceae bacterium]|nr:hypothetical protein [Muribaculaceae bacterium]
MLDVSTWDTVIYVVCYKRLIAVMAHL